MKPLTLRFTIGLDQIVEPDVRNTVMLNAVKWELERRVGQNEVRIAELREENQALREVRKQFP